MGKFGTRDTPFLIIGIAVVAALLVTWLFSWYWAVLLAGAIVAGGMGWGRTLGRADAPLPHLVSSTPAFMRGDGTTEAPFVVRGKRLIPPGGWVQSDEEISVQHLIPGSIVRLEDVNDAHNKGRFKAVPADRSAPPSLDLKADVDGRLAFLLVFDDSEHRSLEGEEFVFQGRLGKNEVCLSWEVHMKEAREYVEARAAFEAAQVRRTGERASLQARYESAIQAGEDEAKALAARNAAEDALTEEEKSERLALHELEAATKAEAADTAADVEEEVAALAEAAEVKRKEQEEMLQAARDFEEAEAEARAEAKALKQAEKTLKKAEKQAEAAADDGHADDASHEGDEAGVDGLDEEALRADKEERIEREIAEQSGGDASADEPDVGDAEDADDAEDAESQMMLSPPRRPLRTALKRSPPKQKRPRRTTMPMRKRRAPQRGQKQKTMVTLRATQSETLPPRRSRT